MTELSNGQRGFLRLLMRSPDIGDGWRQASNILWGATKHWTSENPELYELDEENQRVRLTNRGVIVSEYL